MPWQQLKETAMDPVKRVLLRVSVPQEEIAATFGEKEGMIPIEEFVDSLMGRRAEQRYAFIQGNASLVHHLDVQNTFFKPENKEYEKVFFTYFFRCLKGYKKYVMIKIKGSSV